ncbi:Polynucleotidyl transferase ribonuclease H-like superfamily protein [Euphorbia peplus]|nr:Polynucleotidyl transferase ribonuclease H-like superfamily protein [Euphorbia peplus]
MRDETRSLMIGYGNIHKRKCNLLKRLKDIQEAMELISTPTMIETEDQILQDLETTLKQEEDLWNQKSRSKWIQEGDRNTAYFHNVTIARRRRNFISGLKIEGSSWCSVDSEIHKAAVVFYNNLFTDDRPYLPRYNCRGKFPSYNDEFRDMIGMAPVDSEIKQALFDMHPWKSPDIDGFQAGFYQRHWDRMSTSICSFVKDAFRTGSFDPEINRTLIVLIPKKNRPETFGDLRPISLCNVVYKIITKLIANRLKSVMPQLVLPHQTSFVAGRNITDNTIIAQEAIHTMRKKTGQSGWMAIKVDLEKAYDRLCWDFIDDTLQQVGIPSGIIKLIMFCVSSSSLQILWNGRPSETILPTRGIRQGDPLSPYIFVLCMECLAHQIGEDCIVRRWNPLKLGTERISHLFFADDLLLFAKASPTQALTIKNTLDEFCVASGHQVSQTKTNIFFSPNLTSRVKRSILDILPFSPTDDLGKYLGMPLLHTKIQRGTYQYIIEGIQSKLSGWASQTLSLAGRITLAKAVLSAIPYYSMQTAKLPIHICTKIDDLIRRFIWGSSNEKRKINMVRWEEVCSLIKCGGLGIRSSKHMNNVFLMKLSFNFLQHRELLWVRVLAAKYKTASLLDISVKLVNQASPLWRAMLKTRSDLSLGLKWTIGDGTTTKFWTDNWVGDLGPLILLSTGPISEGTLHLSVADMVDDIGRWRWHLFHHLLPDMCNLSIVAYLVCHTSGDSDQCFWMGTSSGIFSVKSAYELIADEVNSTTHRIWDFIWKWPGPNRIRCFLWLIAKGRILTNQERKRRHLTDEDICCRCNLHPESIIHVLRDCPIARSLWIQVLPHVDFEKLIAINEDIWFERCLTTGKTFSIHRWNILFPVICWHLWKSRNTFIFEGSSPKNVAVISRINARVNSISVSNTDSALSSPHARPSKHECVIGWKLPPVQWVKLNTDGAVKCSHFQASACGIIRDCQGSWIYGFARKIGRCSVVKAKLWGIYDGLILAWNLGFIKVQVEVDSLLCVDLLHRQSTLSNDLLTLIVGIRTLQQRNWEISISHTYREGNRGADFMANLAATVELGIHFFDRPPMGVHRIIEQDLLGVSFPRICNL